jgi:hypothetical protein
VSTTQPIVAYLARGKLHVRFPNKPPQEIESAFAQQFIDRQMRDLERDGWKDRSGVWAGMGMAPPSMQQWNQAGASPIQQPKFLALARDQEPHKLLYAISFGHVGGLFRYDLDQDQELRLMHKEAFAPRDLAMHAESATLALALEREPGAVRLATSKHEGRFLTTVASGDTLDAAPAWVPGDTEALVFQSARIGRNPHGMALGLGPFAIRRVDLASGNLETVVESKEHDLLAPQMAVDGSLYYIRRPYESGEKPPKFTDFVLDVILFPYRVLRAMFYIANFFSTLATGQPLATTAGNPHQRSPEDLMALTLWGRMIDTKKALAERSRSGDAAVVPKNWELIHRDKEGKEDVLATNVLAFDLSPAGEVVYSNGFTLFERTTEGATTKLCDDELIERVVIVGPVCRTGPEA